jgi:hypothetical protein
VSVVVGGLCADFIAGFPPLGRGGEKIRNFGEMIKTVEKN